MLACMTTYVAPSDLNEAARALLAEAGYTQPVDSALTLARALNVDVVEGAYAARTHVVFAGSGLLIQVDARAPMPLIEAQVADALATFALRRAGITPLPARAQYVRALLVTDRLALGPARDRRRAPDGVSMAG